MSSSASRSAPQSGASAQLRCLDVGFARADRRIVDGLTVTIGPGDRVGLTGPNGAGKSTLLALAAGRLTPDQGSVSVVPSTATVGLLDQELRPLAGETIRAWIERRLGVTTATDALEHATRAVAAGSQGAADDYDRALHHWLAIGAATLDERLPGVLDGLGFDPSRTDDAADVLSGGERARVGLAALELAEFDILLLDEPTNDLDLAGLDRLEGLLSSTSRPFVMVSHDRRLLERTVNAVVELDPYTMTATRFGGGWESFLAERATARDHEERNYADYVTKRSDLEARARTERSWATKGATRAVRNPRDGDKFIRHFAVESSENLAARARRTERAIERLDVVDKPWEPWRLEFDFGTAERSGDLVVDLHDAVIDRGDFRLGPLDMSVRVGERVHLSGPNGSGKTSLLRALLGELPLTSGLRRVGPAVSFGLIDQRRAFITSPLDHLLAATGSTIEECRGTLAKFGLSADHVVRPADQLSPGERTRSLLAAFMLRGVNTVVLDEPTNHLDIEAIEQLESALARFAGTLIVVSHDRAFLDQVAMDRMIEVDGLNGCASRSAGSP